MPIAILYGGPLSYALARLAALGGARSEARELFAAALADCDQLGAAGLRAQIAQHGGQ